MHMLAAVAGNQLVVMSALCDRKCDILQHEAVAVSGVCASGDPLQVWLVSQEHTTALMCQCPFSRR